ncbi:MAG: hypothetical protein ABWW70_06655 [Thermoproteota archaeon]
MSQLKKLILVTADHHPQHKLWTELAEKLAKELGAELDVRYEDYVLLVEHGDTDDLGMAWLPQLLAELDDGKIVLLLSRLPLGKDLNPDLEEAYRAVIKRVNEITSVQGS